MIYLQRERIFRNPYADIRLVMGMTGYIRFYSHVFRRTRVCLRRTALCVTLLFLFASCRDTSPDRAGNGTTSAPLIKTTERGQVTASVRVDRRRITVAERLNLQFRIEVDEDQEVVFPGFGEKLGEFRIVDSRTTQPELAGETRKRLTRTYVLDPFLSGTYTIPSVTIAFHKRNGPESDKSSIATKELEITVESLLAGNAEGADINDIKPPLLPPETRTWMLWAAAGIALAAACIAAAVVLRRRRRAETADKAPVRPPHQVAYEELDQLADMALVKQGKVKRFYQRLSTILRRYIENRFGLRAPEQTTGEFLETLRQSSVLPAEHKALLKRFLNHCDLVKFAELQPGEGDIKNAFDNCRAFIDATVPTEDNEKVAAAEQQPPR